MAEKSIRVGITHGDVNGVGYEIILKTFSDARVLEFCTPVIYGSSKIAAYHRKVMDLLLVNLNTITRAEDVSANRVNVINCVNEELKVELGKADPLTKEAAKMALNRALEDLKSGLLDILLTAPVSHSVEEVKLLEKEFQSEGKALILFIKDNFRVALVTNKVPLSEVSNLLSVELILEKLQKFQESLIRDFSITMPRIAVLSLNPSGGEDGFQGKEEKDSIIPAIEAADKAGIICFGPYSSDEFFGSGNYSKFDGILAMYHDQGTVPFRTMAMEDGVCMIANLPVCVTSPIHGVMYDIAGQNLASEDSFRNALYLSVDVFRNRKIDNSINANPLKKQYFERGSDNEKLDLTRDE